MGNNLNPIRSHGQERASNDTVIEPPFNDFNSRNTEKDLSNKSNVKGVGDGIFRDIVIVGKSAGITVKESEPNGIGKSDQTVDK